MNQKTTALAVFPFDDDPRRIRSPDRAAHRLFSAVHIGPDRHLKTDRKPLRIAGRDPLPGLASASRRDIKRFVGG